MSYLNCVVHFYLLLGQPLFSYAGWGKCLDNQSKFFDVASYNGISSANQCATKCEPYKEAIVGFDFSNLNSDCFCRFTPGYLTGTSPSDGNCPDDSTACSLNEGKGTTVVKTDSIYSCYENDDFEVRQVFHCAIGV